MKNQLFDTQKVEIRSNKPVNTLKLMFNGAENLVLRA